jgi:hypothetical protein
MTAINIHEAKTHLSRMVDKAVEGEPLVVVQSLAQAASPPRPRGVLPDLLVPDKFDTWAADEVAGLFEGRR